jgi:hypothetical protein
MASKAPGVMLLLSYFEGVFLRISQPALRDFFQRSQQTQPGNYFEAVSNKRATRKPPTGLFVFSKGPASHSHPHPATQHLAIRINFLFPSNATHHTALSIYLTFNK